MIGPKEKGGLDMWLNESTLAASWSHTPVEYLKPVGGRFFYSDVTLT